MRIIRSIIAVAFATCFAATAAAGPATRTQRGLDFEAQGLKVKVEFYSDNIVRVYKEPAGKPYNKVSIPVIMQPEAVSLTYGGSGTTTTMATGKVTVSVNTETGGIAFADAKGNQMLRDKDYGTQFTPRDDAGRPSFEVRQAFLLDTAEVIYGLGQQQTGLVSQRNQRLLLRNQNMSICIPFVHSAKGYGLYWDNYSPTVFTDNPQEMSFTSEVGDCADYYFIYGGTADGVIAGVRQLTGQAPMYPLWTLGFWQSRERYKSPDELCGVVDKYRELQVPLDGIIQDWQYWGCDSNWNSMKFQNPRYVNKIGDPEYMRFLPKGEDPKALQAEPRIKSPKEMVDYVHSRNAHIMISVWASFGPWTDMYHKMDSIGALYDFETWPRKAGVKPYDPFNPAARDLYWAEMKRNIFDLGMDAWWLDSTEPDHFDIKDSDFDVKTYLGSFRSVHNAFPLVTNRGVYEHQRQATSDKRVFLLTRSSFLGQQHYASHSWSGDVTSTWDNMRRQLAAGLNYSLCGIPYWGTDLGGFFASRYRDAIKNVAYHELHVRWYEWGAFQPIMRSHNSSPVAVEIYQFGEKRLLGLRRAGEVHAPALPPAALPVQHHLGGDEPQRKHHAPARDGLRRRQARAQPRHGVYVRAQLPRAPRDGFALHVAGQPPLRPHEGHGQGGIRGCLPARGRRLVRLLDRQEAQGRADHHARGAYRHHASLRACRLHRALRPARAVGRAGALGQP